MAKSSDTETKPEMPFLDLSKLVEQLKLPGVDMSKLLESQRKDIEALVEANRQAYEGLQALGQRQAEMFKAAAAEWQEAVKNAASADAANAGRQMDLARQALEKTLGNMRELAEMAAQSQSQAWEVVQKRFQENLAELRKAFQPK